MEFVDPVLEQYKQANVSHYLENWAPLLPLAEFATNNYQEETTTVTPFPTNNSGHSC
jgi:hypothetical protein